MQPGKAPRPTPSFPSPASRRAARASGITMNAIRFRALPLLALLAALSPARAAMLEVSSAPFGKTSSGQTVEVYTLSNSNGLKVRAMTFGATLIGVEAPDRYGKSANVTLHLDSFADYEAGHPSLGSTVGRFANRIGHARFVIDGKEFKLTPNSAPHHIHGGKNGFGKLLWRARPLRERDRVGVEFALTSPDGDEGYPGTVKVRALYWLNEANELTLEYFGETDQPTHLNLTNHAYWNLGGAGSGDVLGHRLTLHADHYLAIDEKKIPTGPLVPVRDTPFDFTMPHTIGERIAEVAGGGYDHCYVVRRAKPGELVPLARVEDPRSGRVMEILTTQPGVQLYTANYLSNKLKAGGKAYDKHHGVCFEAQAFPDAPNKPSFPSSLLRPGETYHHVTVHRFSTGK
jgi:aldose 1-epimerase